MSRYPDGTTPPGDGGGFGPGTPSGEEATGEEPPPGGFSSPGDLVEETPDPKKNALVVLLVVAAMAALIVAIGITTAVLGSGSEPSLAEDLTRPPSLRQESPTSNAASAGQGFKAQGFNDVRCTFSGSSTLDPGLSPELPQRPSAQKMELKPGAGFNCVDEYGPSSGKVSMSAKFPDLTALSGEGVGSGLIEWETVPPDAPGVVDQGATGQLRSKTHNEVELVLPQIIVWITILDGPYEGMKGKLVLDDWELVQDTDRTIIEVRFQPTDFSFAGP